MMFSHSLFSCCWLNLPLILPAARTLSLKRDWMKISENNRWKTSPLLPLLSEHCQIIKHSVHSPMVAVGPISLYAQIKNIHNAHTQPSELNKFNFCFPKILIFACQKIPDFCLPKSSGFLLAKKLFLQSGCETGAKSLSKANNKFEEHTLGQFTQPDFTFKPWKVNYWTFLNS